MSDPKPTRTDMLDALADARQRLHYLLHNGKTANRSDIKTVADDLDVIDTWMKGNLK